VDKVCACVLLTHSQGGSFGLKVAEAPCRQDQGRRRCRVRRRRQSGQRRALKNIPVLMLLGDNVDLHPRWAAYRKLDVEYAAAVRAAGGKVDVINLPDLGIKGNSHMVMMDKTTMRSPT
jgi:hypothetical protein